MQFSERSRISGHYAHFCDINNCTLIGTRKMGHRPGGVTDHINVSNRRVRDCHIEGFLYGCADALGDFIVENCTFRDNVIDVRMNQGTLRQSGRTVSVNGCAHLGRERILPLWRASERVGQPCDYYLVETWQDQRDSFDSRVLTTVPMLLDGRAVYFPSQRAEHVPFATAVDIYGGLTNRQLWDQFGQAVAGSYCEGDIEPISGAIGAGFWLKGAPPAPSPRPPTPDQVVSQIQALLE